MVHPNRPLKMQEVQMDNMKAVMFSMKEASLHKIIKDKMTIMLMHLQQVLLELLQSLQVD